jgi:hypothetical protein
MTEKKWAYRSRSVCEFLVSIGVDPYTVCEDGVNEAGYQAIVQEKLVGDTYQRFYDDFGALTVFVPWPNGDEDYQKFRAARAEDDIRVYGYEDAICESCGEVDLTKLPD